MTCSLFLWCEKTGWACCVSCLLQAALVPGVGNSERGRVAAGKLGREPLPQKGGAMGRRPLRSMAALVFSSRALFYQQHPTFPSDKESEKCLHLQGKAWGWWWPHRSSIWSHILLPTDALAPWDVLSLTRAPKEGGICLLTKGWELNDRLLQLISALFQWGRGISNSEWPGGFPNAQQVKLHRTGAASGRQEPLN